jgi:hypothetical protein
MNIHLEISEEILDEETEEYDTTVIHEISMESTPVMIAETLRKLADQLSKPGQQQIYTINTGSALTSVR